MNLEIYFGTIIFFLGLVMGSFYNVCIYRIPLDRSVISPPSACPSCGHRLNYLDMIPVLSHFFLRGRCRYCKTKVSVRYSLVELLTGLLFLVSFLQTGFSLELPFFLIFISFMIIITFIDLDHRIIPDRFFVAGIILAILYLFMPLISGENFIGQLFVYKTDISKFSDLPFMSAIFGALIGGGSLLLIDFSGRIIFKKESMGFGDVKLMIWIGFFLGNPAVILALLFAIWSGAIVGVYLLRKRKIDGEDDRYMPFGPFLIFGSVIAMLFADKIINWYVNYF